VLSSERKSEKGTHDELVRPVLGDVEEALAQHLVGEDLERASAGGPSSARGVAGNGRRKGTHETLRAWTSSREGNLARTARTRSSQTGSGSTCWIMTVECGCGWSGCRGEARGELRCAIANRRERRGKDSAPGVDGRARRGDGLGARVAEREERRTGAAADDGLAAPGVHRRMRASARRRRRGGQRGRGRARLTRGGVCALVRARCGRRWRGCGARAGSGRRGRARAGKPLEARKWCAPNRDRGRVAHDCKAQRALLGASFAL